jgi:hypothetical protein
MPDGFCPDHPTWKVLRILSSFAAKAFPEGMAELPRRHSGLVKKVYPAEVPRDEGGFDPYD